MDNHRIMRAGEKNTKNNLFSLTSMENVKGRCEGEFKDFALYVLFTFPFIKYLGKERRNRMHL